MEQLYTDQYYAIEAGKNYLAHFGIKGMKWGRRRYENYDGTLTEAGRRRYGSQKIYDSKKRVKQARKNIYKTVRDQGPAGIIRGLNKDSKEYRDQVKARNRYLTARKWYKSARRNQRKKADLSGSQAIKVEKLYLDVTGKRTIGSLSKKGREKEREALIQIRKQYGPEAYDYMRRRIMAGRVGTVAIPAGVLDMYLR